VSEITGILLAAGSSRRFGANKLLHQLPDGDAMAVTSARNLLGPLDEVIAVIRPEDQELKEALSLPGIQVVESPRADEGMSTSIAAGIQVSIDAEGWVVALADMPWVEPETIKLLVDALQQGASIVVPECEGQRGNPVGFAAKWKDVLCSLSGDKGARELIKSHASDVVHVEVKDSGVLRDVDVLEDV
jgi:molybdenum cofactor cytidylyltransferase